MFGQSRIVVLAAMLLSCVGCEAPDATLSNDLKATGMAYHNFHDLNTQGPAGWDEFLQHAQQMGDSPDALQRVRDAGYELQWGVKFSRVSEGLSNTVLAKRAAGGPTLMMDGSVRRD